MNYISLIKTYYPAFTPTEVKIAEYFLKNQQKTAVLKLNDVANEIDISRSAVTKFFKKLGYKGFRDFKRDLINDISGQTEIETGYFIEDISYKLKESIKKTQKIIDEDDIRKAAYMISHEDIIIFCEKEGVDIAEFFRKILFENGVVSQIYSDFCEQRKVAQINKDYLYLAINIEESKFYKRIDGIEKLVVFSTKVKKSLINRSKIFFILDDGKYNSRISALYILSLIDRILRKNN